MKFVTTSPQETVRLGEALGAKLKGGDMVAYEGGLGAGKTTFTGGVAKGFGVKDQVSSPTYTLVNEYTGTGKRICHFDMYRINGEEELETTGFYDYLDDQTVMVIEWSENISSALPENTVRVKFTILDEQTREIEITGDDRFEDTGDRNFLKDGFGGCG